MSKNEAKKVKMLASKTVFTLGSLQVYTLELQKDGHTQLGAVENGFYWADAASPQGYGPFDSLYGAMEHYKWVIQASKGVTVHTTKGPKTMGEVIRVDFRGTRKRVRDEV